MTLLACDHVDFASIDAGNGDMTMGKRSVTADSAANLSVAQAGVQTARDLDTFIKTDPMPPPTRPAQITGV
jgi:hypothetical protein